MEKKLQSYAIMGLTNRRLTRRYLNNVYICAGEVSQRQDMKCGCSSWLLQEKKTEMGRLDDRTDTVIQHLTKIWLFPEYRSVDTWMYHAWKGIHKTSKVKKSGYLPANDIYSTTWGDNSNLVDVYLDHFIDRHDNYGEYPGYMRDNATRNKKVLMECMRKYFTKLAEALHDKGIVKETEVKNFIRSSGFLD